MISTLIKMILIVLFLIEKFWCCVSLYFNCKQVKFKGKTGPVYFDEYGERRGIRLEILNLQNDSLTTVGKIVITLIIILIAIKPVLLKRLTALKPHTTEGYVANLIVIFLSDVMNFQKKDCIERVWRRLNPYLFDESRYSHFEMIRDNWSLDRDMEFISWCRGFWECVT